jgi:hypothetical protein
LIHKVNRPDLQLIVSSPKATENDPGSSQGGGVAYERPPGKQEKDESTTRDEGGNEEPTKGGAPPAEQIGLGEVLREFKESHKSAPVRPGLATHYQSEGGNAKGLLLNKKVE